MLLAIDAGNTQTVIGLFDGENLLISWRIQTDPAETPDEIYVKLATFFKNAQYDLSVVDTVIIGSVVPDITGAWERVASLLTSNRVLVIGTGIATGVNVVCCDPSEIGADRIANCAAAKDQYGLPIIVVDFGTATTLDVVNSRGEYLGGTTSPGVETSAEALFAKAARLFNVNLELPAKVIGYDTPTSIQSGILIGEAAKIDGLVARIELELGEKPTIVATGGMSGLIAPASERIEHVDINLTLNGLRIIADLN